MRLRKDKQVNAQTLSSIETLHDRFIELHDGKTESWYPVQRFKPCNRRHFDSGPKRFADKQMLHQLLQSWKISQCPFLWCRWVLPLYQAKYKVGSPMCLLYIHILEVRVWHF